MTCVNRTCDLERLRALLEAHGSNPVHWPVADAARLAAFARTDARAKRMLAEAQAFDKVLAAAPSARSDRMDGLLDRVMVTVMAPRPQAVTGGTATGSRIADLPLGVRSATGQTAFRHRRLWPVYGALAASLILGFYVGISGYAAPAWQQVAGLQQDEADSGATVQPVADEGQEGELL